MFREPAYCNETMMCGRGICRTILIKKNGDPGGAGRNMDKYGESVFKDRITDRKKGRGTA